MVPEGNSPEGNSPEGHSEVVVDQTRGEYNLIRFSIESASLSRGVLRLADTEVIIR